MSSEKIFVTGNTIVDALESIKEKLPTDSPYEEQYVLATIHRRESFGDKMIEIFEALKELSKLLPDKVEVMRDGAIVSISLNEVKEKIEEFKPDIVGISSMTFEYGDAINLASFVKKKVCKTCLCRTLLS